MKVRIIPLVLTLLLSACGFHLRGMINVPTWLNNVAIISQANEKKLHSMLKEQLEGYNIYVDPDEAHASYWLIINGSSLQQQIISVGASTNPRQYTLILTVDYQLQTRKGQIIVPPKKVIVTRQLTINNDRILGSSDEERILVDEMKQDAVVQIINQISHRKQITQ